MTKTLADMTPEERTECVGMWVDTSWGLGVLLDIYDEDYCPDDNEDPMPIVWLWSTSYSKRTMLRGLLHEVTPRFDLPRAWNPDGTPLSQQ